MVQTKPSTCSGSGSTPTGQPAPSQWALHQTVAVQLPPQTREDLYDQLFGQGFRKAEDLGLTREECISAACRYADTKLAEWEQGATQSPMEELPPWQKPKERAGKRQHQRTPEKEFFSPVPEPREIPVTPANVTVQYITVGDFTGPPSSWQEPAATPAATTAATTEATTKTEEEFAEELWEQWPTETWDTPPTTQTQKAQYVQRPKSRTATAHNSPFQGDFPQPPPLPPRAHRTSQYPEILVGQVDLKARLYRKLDNVDGLPTGCNRWQYLVMRARARKRWAVRGHAEHHRHNMPKNLDGPPTGFGHHLGRWSWREVLHLW